jgi:hypothetical protein
MGQQSESLIQSAYRDPLCNSKQRILVKKQILESSQRAFSIHCSTLVEDITVSLLYKSTVRNGCITSSFKNITGMNKQCPAIAIFAITAKPLSIVPR